MADQVPPSKSETSPYPDVALKPDLPAIEAEVLARWDAEGTFDASIQARAHSRPGDDVHHSAAAGDDDQESGRAVNNEYVFYDGPPFANGLPHYGHILTGYVKDVVPRYQTMRGRRVERRFGWDCHGLPAEMNAESELGVHGRKAIEDYGIDRFNDHCRSSVLRYRDDWESYVRLQARWVDFENDYKTMDTDFMESVIWAFAQLWRKGLVYEDYRVMPYSWGAETPLSNFEIRLDDATRERQDPAVTIAFTLEKSLTDQPMKLLAWTTTPWTLPSNLALAVGSKIEYSIVAHNGDHLVVASEALGRHERIFGPEPEVVSVVSGADLQGLSYEPLFEFFRGHAGAFGVLTADFVETDDGTGIVHLAPGFGEEDQSVCAAAGIEPVVPVDDAGRFTEEVTPWVGINVFDANAPVIAHLKEAGKVLLHDTIDHNYPHCWRTDTPIIYRAVSSWYVRVTDFKDRLTDLNNEINWIPSHVRDGAFGRWLEGARDWSISRNRFWGSPLPVWRSDNPDYPRTDVYGSLDEIEADFGVRPKDLHRPAIDELTRPNPDDPTGDSTMRRVPEVLDCWFESGSMPFAQVHYPFENAQWFDAHNPADFIVEYIAQTRGWFYTLHVLGTALFDRPAFKNVICHGVLLDSEGRKFSKRLKNYRDPKEIFATYGSDAFRWYLMSSPILRGLDLKVAADASQVADVVRLVINPIWNAFRFFTSYANIDGRRATPHTNSKNLLDRYLIARTHELVVAATAAMDSYDLAAACEQIEGFTDSLNNWYIRRSRARFWVGDDASDADIADKHDAYDSLAFALQTLTQVAAPMLPLFADAIYGGLNDGESVHLTDWPNASVIPSDPDLVLDTELARDACSAALSLREQHRIKVRTPLASLTIAGPRAERLNKLAASIAEEVNVKEVIFESNASSFGEFTLAPSGRAIGPRLGGETQRVIAEAKAGNWTLNADGSVEVSGHTLSSEEYELRLLTDDPATAGLGTGDSVVKLDIDLTEELMAEGMARDTVRQIQQARKEADLHVADRIKLLIASESDDLSNAIASHRDWIAAQVLASNIELSEPSDGGFDVDIDGAPLRFSFEVVPA